MVTNGRGVFATVVILLMVMLTAGAARSANVLNGHTVVLDGGGGIIPWTADPAKGYDQVVSLAWNYLLTAVPNDSGNGQPMYLSHSYLIPDTQQAADWPHNPAGLYAMLVESALKYYAYSGDPAPVTLAVNVATALLDHGMTTSGWEWSNVPYASGDSGSLTYQGAAIGNTTGRGDGTGVIEPDKVGEMGAAWLKLYRFGGNTRFRDAAIAAGDALASHVRTGSATSSPWPFRVYAQTGVVREDYCADVIGPITLFDGLIALGLGNTQAYQSARQTAWNWLTTYPMRNNVWANYFEDVQILSDLSNVNNYNALMTARYLLEHPETDPAWETDVRGLIGWIEKIFAITSYGANTITIAEQAGYFYPMGSHTSRYASVNALLYEKTADAAAKEKAYRSLNWATYMARPNGVVIVGPDVLQQWFTDGYGDYIRHFLTALGAVPEWGPAGQNHLLRSSSVVQAVSYTPLGISYTTADPAATEVLRTIAIPASVTVNGTLLSQRTDLAQEGWTYDPTLRVLRIRHDSGRNVQINQALSSIAVTPADRILSPGSTLQLAAVGSFFDGSTQDITALASWKTTDSGVATVSALGLLSGLAPGNVSVTATFAGVSGSANQTVQSAPLAVTTTSLPGGSVNVSYSAALAATGGIPPYAWSLASGSLPPGITLSGAGTLSGMPTTAGTSTFSVRVADSGAPQQSLTASFSITVASVSSFTIWPASAVPVIADAGADSAVELGVKFRCDYAGYVTGVRFYKATTNTGTHVGNLWTSSGSRLATATFANESAQGWQQVNFATPVAIAANTYYVVSYHNNVGHYANDQNYFTGKTVDRVPLHAPADGTSGANGVYAYGANSTFPTLGWRGSNYWVDVVVSTTPPADTTAPTVTAFSLPAASAILNVPIAALSASDNLGVTGYLVSESSLKPSASALGWSATPPASYAFAIEGSHTLYAFAKDAAGNVSAALTATTVVDLTPPSVPTNLAAIAAGSSLVNLTWSPATDNFGVAGYRILRNGTAIATIATTSYSDATVLPATSYTYTVRAYDAAGNSSGDSNPASVTTPQGAATPQLDVTVTTKQSSSSRTITSPAFSTAGTNEFLIAFLASDGPQSGIQSFTSVTGGGLTWSLRARANAQAGCAEIWVARATGRLSNVTVTATRGNGSHQGMITITAFQGASPTVEGATATASAGSGAPALALVASRANSLVFGVGTDWDRAVSRVVSAGQVKLTEFLAPADDTFWVQYLGAPTPSAGSIVTISCAAPTNDRWNLSAIEIVPQ